MMRVRRSSWVPRLALLLATLPAAASEPGARLHVEPDEASVGDHLRAVLTVTLPPGATLEETDLSDRFGPFTVLEGSWAGGGAENGSTDRTWNGTLSAYRTGELEIPPISLRFRAGEEEATIATAPRTIRIVSLLDAPSDGSVADAELSDLKPPASLVPEYAPLWIALALVALLLGAAAGLWWLQRRYGARLAAARVPDDPFHRTPPHVWFYAELKKLLERGLELQGRSDLFYEELSRIVKLYLGGRYRIDLMERTTEEVPEALAQAAVPEDAIRLIRDLLAGADQVKFAKRRPEPGDCRASVEQAYKIGDRTRPAEPREGSESREAVS